MSQETLEFHHDIHHKAYVDNGNKLLADSEHQGKSLEEIIMATYNAGSVVQEDFSIMLHSIGIICNFGK